MKNLDQQLKGYYRSKRLAPQRIAAIRASVHKASGTRSRMAYRLPLVATVLLALGIGIWLTVRPGGSLTQRLVAEIEHNHRQPGSLVVESDQFSVVQVALSKLDFPIRPQRDRLVQSFSLIGGKYCAIQGSQAAQLKLRHHDSGIIHTLYVWPMTDDTKGVEPGVYETNGVRVELWAEQPLLYGLARIQ